MFQTQQRPAERPSNLKTVLAINIKAARISRGMTQRELARLASLDRNHLGDLENCFGNPTLAIIERIAKALDTTAAALIVADGLGVPVVSDPSSIACLVGHLRSETSQ